MNIFIEEAQRRKNFTICRSSIYTSRQLSKSGQTRYAQDPFRNSACRNIPKKNGLGILSRHIFYMNFTSYNQPQPAFMNIIREPVDRCVSRFYYERDSRGTVHGTMTMDECMESGPCRAFKNYEPANSVATGSGSRTAQMIEECSSNYLSRWFCGMDAVCKEGSRRTLEKAKYNMEKHYAFVGLTAEMKRSFAYLQKTLPDFFANPDIPTDICNKCKEDTSRDGIVSNSTKPARINDKNSAILQELNYLDIELYDFAKALFARKLRDCGIP